MSLNRRHALALLLLALAGCGGSTTQAALKVEVALGDGAASKCTQVVIRTEAGSETRSTPVDFNGKKSVVVGVLQDALPKDLTIYAIGYSDVTCMTPSNPVERADETSASFVTGKVQPVSLTLTVRPQAKDDDGDGYLSASTGGDDCDDHNPAVHPGAVEICNNHLDDDCAHGKDCEDSFCEDKECGPVVGARCRGALCAEAVCDDGIDNDDDGPVDCADSDCGGKACKNGGTCANGSCQHATTETGLCGDGIDNDGDQLIDCADPDCLGQTCTNGNLCLKGMTCDASHQCVGGSAVVCNPPPSSCFFAGQCVPGDGGCFYPPNPGGPCDDGNLCTGPDSCDDAGTCGGPAVSCPVLGPCLRPSGCAAATGCMYMPAPGNSCDDQNPCTQGDSCLGDAGCAGTVGPCPAPDCQSSVGCSPDAGCVFAPLDAGTACDAGLCNATGSCISFPYAPSNFTEAQLPTPQGPVVLDCGATTVTTFTADGGVAFDNWCGGAPAFAVIPQANGPDAVLISANGFTLAVDGGLNVTGDRPLIIASLKGIDVLGKIHSSAGADACATGGAGGPVASDKGAGGGGFGTAGKGGGNSGSMGGGAVSTSLVPLRGGCPGGGKGGIGGSGGGALQLSAAQSLQVVGVISAPGHKGTGGGANEGGRGGGSGGAVLLEGLTVLVGPAAAICTNGGSGGQGGGNVFGGDDGNDGRDDATPAAGGHNGLIVGGAGGDGAAGMTDATGGSDGAVGGAGGAGAGGLGHIQLNTATACSLGGGLLSGVVSSNQADAGCQ